MFLAGAFVDHRGGCVDLERLLEKRRFIAGARSPTLIAGSAAWWKKLENFMATGVGRNRSKGGAVFALQWSRTWLRRRYLLRQEMKIPHREYQLHKWHPTWSRSTNARDEGRGGEDNGTVVGERQNEPGGSRVHPVLYRLENHTEKASATSTESQGTRHKTRNNAFVPPQRERARESECLTFSHVIA